MSLSVIDFDVSGFLRARLSMWFKLAFSRFLIFQNGENLINQIQEYYSYLSMPILSAFIIGLLFRNVNANAIVLWTIFAVAFYAFMVNVYPAWPGGNFIDMMAIDLIVTVCLALCVNRLIFRQKAQWEAHNVFGRKAEIA